MIARSFDCPATGGERNCKLVQLAKAVGCIGNCDAGQCRPIGVQSHYRVSARMWIDTESDHAAFPSNRECALVTHVCRSRYKAPWYPAITPAHSRMWRAVQFNLKPSLADNARATTHPFRYTDNAVCGDATACIVRAKVS